eukprot:scaffold2269_cov219-Ochromonas_danica.AAC.1
MKAPRMVVVKDERWVAYWALKWVDQKAAGSVDCSAHLKSCSLGIHWADQKADHWVEMKAHNLVEQKAGSWADRSLVGRKAVRLVECWADHWVDLKVGKKGTMLDQHLGDPKAHNLVEQKAGSWADRSVDHLGR